MNSWMEVGEKIEQMLAEWSSQPGIAVCLRNSDGAKHFFTSGLANLEHDIPVDRKTVFDIASVSKHFTGLAVRMLADRGLINMDAPIRTYLPEMNPEICQDITVFHLLNHTSGLRGKWDLLAAAGYTREDAYTRAQCLNLFTRQTSLNYEPGERYLYVNTGFILAAEIVERVTGMRFRAFMEQELFEPLGMHAALVHDNYQEVIPHLALSYEYDDGYAVGINTASYVGSTNIYLNIEDFGRWIDNLCEPTIAGDSVAQMGDFRPLNDGTPHHYAYGMEVKARGGYRIWCHGGGIAGYRAFMIVLPDEKKAVAIISNNSRMAAEKTAFELLDLIAPGIALQEVRNAAEIRIGTSSEADKLCGHYLIPAFGLGYIFYKADILHMRSSVWMGDIRIFALPDGRYSMEFLDLPLVPEYDDQGSIIALVGEDPTGQTVRAARAVLPDISAEKRQDYLGRYYSRDLLTLYEVSDAAERLRLYHPHHPELTLEPVGEDQFRSDVYGFNIIEFMRDEQGTVNGFSITSNRSWNVEFTRIEV